MIVIKETFPGSDMDGCGKTGVDAVAAVLHGDYTGGPAAGNDGNGLTGVAAQRKQEAVEFLVISIDALDDVLPAQSGMV